MNRDIENRRFPWLALSVISMGVTLGLMHLSTAGAIDVGTYFGRRSPMLLLTIVCVCGLLAFRELSRNSGLVVWDARRFRRGLPVAVMLVLPFATGVTIVDIVYSFPSDINVPLPAAIVFYPAIGYIAQVALHVIPFAMLLRTGRSWFRISLPRWWICIAIVLVSMLEAWFQAFDAANRGGPPPLVIYVAISLFLFGAVELVLFRRFDYATMYAFRVLYYGYWHLAWGTLRLWIIPAGQSRAIRPVDVFRDANATGSPRTRNYSRQTYINTRTIP